MQSVEEVIQNGNTQPVTEWVGTPPESWSLVSIGVFDFGGRDGAAQASKGLHRRLGRLDIKGDVRMVDRSRIEEVINELQLATDNQGNFSDLSDGRIAAAAGKLQVGDFLLVSTITHFQVTQQTIPLKAVIEDAAMKRYSDEYVLFKRTLDAVEKENGSSSAAEWLPGFGDRQTALRQMNLDQIRRLRTETPSPEQVQSDLAAKTQLELATLAKVGVMSRLIEVKTSTTVWTYQWEVSGRNAPSCIDRILDDLVARLVAMPVASGSR